MEKIKTDNFDPSAKLALRRYFLNKYHAAAKPHVLDCCQGSGLLWSTLRRDFQLGSYWGLDVKPKKGRVKLDSVRVLAQPGWPQDVIDVDTYGAPWKHWEAMLPHVTKPLTVFLTIGLVRTGTAGRIGNAALAAMGLFKLRHKLSAGFNVKLSTMSVDYCLASAEDHGVRIVEAVEAMSENPNARYIGVRLEPKSVPPTIEKADVSAPATDTTTGKELPCPKEHL